MAESIIFDTHRFVKRMTDAGLAPSIAEALADEYAQLLIRNLATKEDIARLDAKIAETKVEIIKWNVGTMLVFGSILVAALKFL